MATKKINYRLRKNWQSNSLFKSRLNMQPRSTKPFLCQAGGSLHCNSSLSPLSWKILKILFKDQKRFYRSGPPKWSTMAQQTGLSLTCSVSTQPYGRSLWHHLVGTHLSTIIGLFLDTNSCHFSVCSSDLTTLGFFSSL